MFTRCNTKLIDVNVIIIKSHERLIRLPTVMYCVQSTVQLVRSHHTTRNSVHLYPSCVNVHHIIITLMCNFHTLITLINYLLAYYDLVYITDFTVYGSYVIARTSVDLTYKRPSARGSTYSWPDIELYGAFLVFKHNLL